jgi:hypothetical protein
VVDKPKLDQMLSNLRRYLQILRGLAATPRDAFLGNPDKVGNAKYHLVIVGAPCVGHPCQTYCMHGGVS